MPNRTPRAARLLVPPPSFAPALASLALALLASAAFAETPPARADIPLRLPADAVYDSVVGADSAVVFSHVRHAAFADNKCTACHPGTFSILRPARGIAHRDMNAGRSCGSCHDGKQAFDTRDTGSCAACHTGRSKAALAAAPGAGPGTGGAPGYQLPKPIRYSHGEASPGLVTFRHETHMKGAAGCVACHPKPFARRSSAADTGGRMHGLCGACHDGKRGFGVEDADACSRCHTEGGGGR